MTKLYLIIGIMICCLFGYANAVGWDVITFNTIRSVPNAPGIYHK